jgi:predicted nucleic acid-binding protein
MPEQKLYLDSSALAKRYVQEEGSRAVDSIFEDAEKGEASIFFSLWNIGELAVVLEKYERDGLLEAKTVMMTFLGEMKRLGKSKAAEVVPIPGSMMADAIAYALKHHVYVADALQVASCKSSPGARFVTADRRLAGVARDEGLDTSLVS